MDSAGGLYIADRTWGILKLSPGDTAATVIFDTRSEGVFLGAAQVVAVDAGGNVYFAQNSCSFQQPVCSGIIRKLSNGTITTLAGLGSSSADNIPAANSHFGNIVGLAVDSSGNLYIADSGNGNGVVRNISGGVVTTIVGYGTSHDDNVPATSAVLRGLSSMAIDTANNIYVAESQAGLIRKVSKGIIATFAGSLAPWRLGDQGPATSAQLKVPRGVALDSSGNLYIADSGSGVVRKISRGIITTIAGGGSSLAENVPATSALIANPTGVAFGPTGDLYISEMDGRVVRKVSNGIVTTVAGNRTSSDRGDGGPATSAGFAAPAGIAVDGAGNLYIADNVDNRVREVSNGIVTTVVGSGNLTDQYYGEGGPATSASLPNPRSLALDQAGDLYITDFDDAVRKVAKGIITTVPGAGGYNSKGEIAATAVAVDSAGTLYVSGLGVCKVSGGTCTPIAVVGSGSPLQYAPRDFSGITVDPTGNIYVADSLHNLVRVLTPAPCAASVKGSSVPLQALGGSFPYDIETGSGCPWTISGLPDWITVSGATQDSGPAVIILVASANPGPPRLANVSIAGQSVAIFQYGSGSDAVCVFTATSSDQHVGAQGGFRSLNVLITYQGPFSNSGACSGWAGGTQSDWIKLIDSYDQFVSYFYNEGSVNETGGYYVEPNLGPARSGTIVAGGTVVTILQDAYAPSDLISPNAATFPAAGGTGTIYVNAGPYWVSISDKWGVTTSTNYGYGTFTSFTYDVPPNPGAARWTAIVVAFSDSAAMFVVRQVGASTGLQFAPVTPCRVADTRRTAGPFGGPTMTPGSTRSFAIPQSGCGIPSTAQAYALNVTVVPAGPLSFLTLWPAGAAQPGVSTLNSFGGLVVANAAIVPAGSGGGVSVYVTDQTDVILDINGYFDSTASTGSSSFYAAAPCRVADTRGATGQFGGPFMSTDQTRDFPIRLSSCAIPATATAYSLNVTVVPHTDYLGYLTTWPTGKAQPNVSTLNSWTGKIVANAAIVPGGSNESVSVFVTDPTDAILDINGYFGQPGLANELVFYPVAPCRVADTRWVAGPFGGPEMEAGTARSFAIPASGCNVPSTAAAYSVNVTVVPDGALSFLTAWPAGSGQPGVSTLNSFDGSVVANAAIVPAGTSGAISVYVTDRTQVILDINGYFAP